MDSTDETIALRRWQTTVGTFLTPNLDEIVNRELLATGGWQRGLVEYIVGRCFPDGVGTFLDVGAHVGLVTVPVAKAHPKVLCHAFEPLPLNHALLRQNLALNGLAEDPRVSAHNVAVSDKSGIFDLGLSVGNTVDNRLIVGREREPGAYGEEGRLSISVNTVTLDHLLPEVLPRPIVMKMDVQGHELAVLRGMTEHLPDVLIMEYWPYGLERAGELKEEFIRVLGRFTHGAPLLGIDTILRPGLHQEVAQALPWGSTNAIELICARDSG